MSDLAFKLDFAATAVFCKCLCIPLCLISEDVPRSELMVGEFSSTPEGNNELIVKVTDPTTVCKGQYVQSRMCVLGLMWRLD